MFCQLEVLRHCFPSSVRQILEELPESLDETYERILREIRKPNQGHAHRLLQCLVVAARPLRVEELAEILTFDFKAEGIPNQNPGWRWEDQEAAVLSACSSLVIIVKDGDSRIAQFSHFSVKEFLTATRLSEPIRDVSRYHIQLETAHAILAQACLGVLLRLDDRVDRDNIENFPLARYAAQYWPTHARFENASLRIKDGMKRLFDADKPHYATWLWIYDEYSGSSMSTMFPEKPDVVPLYYAARFELRDLVEHLIAEHPEHVNARVGDSRILGRIVLRGGRANILSLLLEHGADVEDRGMVWSPLLLASSEGNVETGQCLLDHGANINARNNLGETPLFRAVFNEHVEFARMLLINKRMASINDLDDNFGWTPLHLAVYTRNIQAVRLLLEHGADVNARSKTGNTPSEVGSLYGYQEIVELLSEFGAESPK